jgi:YTH domain-containing protein 1
LFPEDEAIEMMPILKKSKEMAKHLRENNIKPNFRRPSNPSFSSHRNNGGPPPLRGRGGLSNHHMRGRKMFIKGRGRPNGPPIGIGRKPMLNRMIPNRNPLQRFGGSTTAAAEAYVADYMRTMQYQLPPMPMNPPFGSLPPTLPRYYDGVPTIPDYPPPPITRNPGAAASSNYDKRSYDEFMWKNKNRNPNGGGGGPSISNNRDRSRDSRDTYRSGGDKHRNYRR